MAANNTFMEQFNFATKQFSNWLNADNISEIMVNPGGELWIDILGKGMENTGVTLNPTMSRTIINLVASHTKTTVSEDRPIISAELPDGSRFEGLIPPVVTTPSFSIRKHGSLILTLADYVKSGIMTEEQKEKIENGVRTRQNILVVGGTGSGKTTLVNAVVAAISQLTPEHRIITIEDTKELKVDAPNWVSLRTSDYIDMNRLLKSCMRLRPDRILVGEVRGPEALSLLKAWNTGHPGGCATVHADSAEKALTRLEQLIQEANVPESVARPVIAEAVNIVVFMERSATGRRIREIISVQGYDRANGTYKLEDV